MQEPSRSCDVLVIGAGAGGLSAALSAAVLGLDVIVSEHSEHLGGATALSGGEIWIPGNRQSKSVGADSAEEVERYLARAIGGYLDQPRLEAYLAHAAEALAFLEDNGHLRYELLGHVGDYYSDFPGATEGLRTLGAIPFDGRQLGADFRRIRPPLPASTVFGGMALGREDIPHFTRAHRSLRSLLHVSGMLLRHCRDRIQGHSRGTRMVMGNALVGRLVLSLRERGVPLWTGMRTVELLQEQGRVSGALLEEHHGALCRIHARRGVILATGSFSGSPERRQAYYTHVREGITHLSPLPQTNDGSALELARARGGTLDHNLRQPAAFTPFSALPVAGGKTTCVPHFGDRGRPGVIVVNARGERFANETLNYHDFVEQMLATREAAADARWFLVTSRQHLRKYGLGRVPPFPARTGPFIRNGYLIEADSIATLATRLGIDANALAHTVREHDSHAARGADPAFNRGSTAFQRESGDPALLPNPCIAPLGRGPYYAIRLFPGDIGTFIGLRVDARARVLGEGGHPLPGLYAVGTVSSSVMGGGYPAAGIMLGPALTFGYLAAKAIASDDR